MRFLKWCTVAVTLTFLVLMAMNSSRLAFRPNYQVLLAHRGVHQTYPKDDLQRDSCSQARKLYDAQECATWNSHPQH